MQLLSTEFFINITWVYFVIGIIVNSIFLWVLFRLYTKKVNI
jgi:hypothetical protein